MTFEDEQGTERVVDPFEASVPEPQSVSSDAADDDDDDIVDAHVWRAQS